MNLTKNKKTITTTIATTLLLLIAITTIISFELFFENYQSKIFTNVEQKSNLKQNTQIQDLIKNSIYIKNSEQNLTISEIKIGKKTCNYSNSNLNLGLSAIKLTNCSIKTGSHKIIILTNKGILKKNIFIKNEISPSNNCTFNNKILKKGETITAYKQNLAHYPKSCQSETRTCTNKKLTGTYKHSTCQTFKTTDFISVWNTSIDPGITGLNNLKLPLNQNGKYNFKVNWGDGTTSTVTKWNSKNATHNYAKGGTYYVTILGELNGFGFAYGGNNDGNKLIDIKNWGTVKLKSGSGTFSHLKNFKCWNSFDQPNTSHITNMVGMFHSSPKFNCDINFDTSKVTNMDHMFKGAINFNGKLNFTTTNKVTSMTGMFHGANSFNQPVNFNTSKVTKMTYMFSKSHKFNQPVNFDTSKVTSTSHMFEDNYNFNQPINFNLSQSTSLYYFLKNCKSFNSKINLTNTNKITDVNGMFYGATSFNQPVTFNTKNVTTMSNMFRSTTSFNQPLTFNTSKVTKMDNMFFHSPSFNQTLNFDTSKVTTMSYMFTGATNFSSDISHWCVPLLTSKPYYFDSGSKIQNQNHLQPQWGTCP